MNRSKNISLSIALGMITITAVQRNNSAEIQNLIIDESASSDDTIKNNFNNGEKMEANIGISAANRKHVAKILNELLANEWVLYTKTINFHWNVKGIVFHDFHAMFKEQYEQLLELSDDIAERVRALGERSFGTLAEFLEHSDIKEQPGKVPDAAGMIKILLQDHETIIRLMRSTLDKIATDYGDLGTNNFLTEVMERHEKTAWMLRATLEK